MLDAMKIFDNNSSQWIYLRRGGERGMQLSIPPSHTIAMLLFSSSAYFAANVVKQCGTDTLAIYKSNFIRRFAVVKERRSIAVVLQVVILDGIV